MTPDEAANDGSILPVWDTLFGTADFRRGVLAGYDVFLILHFPVWCSITETPIRSKYSLKARLTPGQLTPSS